ncbi:MAG TPA: WG repeat-containing protein, partial [Clostridia bacterium]|nr:WG repeat-containing protein [Clostridia bacterium]
MAGRKFYRNNNGRPKNNVQKQIALDPQAMKISIADLALSELTTALLEKNNIKNAAELCMRTEKDMYKIQTLNKRVLMEIVNALKKHGLTFKALDAEPAKATTRIDQNNGIKPEKDTTKIVKETAKSDGKQMSRTGKVAKNTNAEFENNDISSLYPASKVDFLSTRAGSQSKVEQLKRVKEPIITSPLAVEEWRKIQRGNKWGFFDGIKTVINPMYDEVFHFKEGLACVELNEKCGYIDSKNNVVIPIEYETAFSFSENLAVVIIGGKCGYINHENELVIP